MEFFIDTGSVADAQEVARWGVLSGATTNPSLLAREGDDPGEVLRDLCEVVGGPVSAEVLAGDPADMVREGRALAALHDRSS